MFESLPKDAHEALDWGWEQYAPYYENLLGRLLSAYSVKQWLADWSALARLYEEVKERLYVAVTVDTTDEAAEKRYTAFVEGVIPKRAEMTDKLNHKLLASKIEPEGFEIALRNMRAEVELFREENLPLLTDEKKLSLEYDKIIGAQTVLWDGEEKTMPAMIPVFAEADASRREAAWRLYAARKLQDREALNGLWVKFMELRGKIADNADMVDYRAWQWKDKKRFDYSPADAETFQKAIEQVVVPVAKRIYDKRRDKLGVGTLRPWDTGGDPQWPGFDVEGRAPLKPYEGIDELNSKTLAIFRKVDPQLGGYYQTMLDEDLLDLDNRKGKAPGGYCTYFTLSKRPFIFMNAVGSHDDVQTLLHEGGHAFHAFESLGLPYYQQLDAPMEFNEVASMSMELIGGPYLAASAGGYYSEADAARARLQHLESIVRFWPYMAVVDSFQHWVYTNHKAASDPANCDAKWGELWDRFIQGIDYSGFEDFKATGWQRKLHIFHLPFYYIEYGLAQLGAVQVWANSLMDQAEAVRNYRKALSLGGTAALPTLFATAGAKFGFDVGTISGAVELIEMTMAQLEQV